MAKKEEIMTLLKDRNIEFDEKAKKPDLVRICEDNSIEIPGMAEEPAGPIERTGKGRFPSRKLEKLREVNGTIKVTQRLDGTSTLYDVSVHPVNGSTEDIASEESFELAKTRARNLAVERQMAFNAKAGRDYTKLPKEPTTPQDTPQASDPVEESEG